MTNQKSENEMMIPKDFNQIR